MKFLAIFIGGGIGSVIRYQLGDVLINRLAFSSSLVTGTVNILGSFLLGGLLAYFARQQDSSSIVALMLTVGFCGGFTTFSTFSYDALTFLKSGIYLQFALYTFGSLVLSFFMFFVGWRVFN